MSFDEHLASIRESLAVEARGTGMMSIPEITERQARRMAIREQIAQLFTEIHRAPGATASAARSHLHSMSPERAGLSQWSPAHRGHGVSR
jgi:hypothetical protein